MTDELQLPEGEKASDLTQDPLHVAGRVAVATALAATLAAGPVAPENIQLPAVTPIVHVIDMGGAQTPDQPADQHADQGSHWKKILKAVVMAVVALLMVGGVLLGALKGCAGGLALPAACTSDEVQQNADSADDAADTEGADVAAAA